VLKQCAACFHASAAPAAVVKKTAPAVQEAEEEEEETQKGQYLQHTHWGGCGGTSCGIIAMRRLSRVH